MGCVWCGGSVWQMLWVCMYDFTTSLLRSLCDVVLLSLVPFSQWLSHSFLRRSAELELRLDRIGTLMRGCYWRFSAKAGFADGAAGSCLLLVAVRRKQTGGHSEQEAQVAAAKT